MVVPAAEFVLVRVVGQEEAYRCKPAAALLHEEIESVTETARPLDQALECHVECVTGTECIDLAERQVGPERADPCAENGFHTAHTAVRIYLKVAAKREPVGKPAAEVA